MPTLELLVGLPLTVAVTAPTGMVLVKFPAAAANTSISVTQVEFDARLPPLRLTEPPVEVTVAPVQVVVGFAPAGTVNPPGMLSVNTRLLAPITPGLRTVICRRDREPA